MGLIDKLKGELVDIIEWIDDSRTTLAWRFPRYNNEIKNGAELIVREGQKAVFVYRGQLADKFEPGHYTLTSEALPILSTLQGWKHGFSSPFRSEVYFINTRPVTDLRWGTPQPITIRDPDFSMIPIRANGLCVVRIADVETFLREIIGTDSAVEMDELTELLRRLIATAFADLLTGSGYGALELQGKNAEIADKLRTLVAERVDDEFGLAIDSIAMNVSLPEEVTAALTAGVARGVETRGYVQNVGDIGRLQQVRAADATLAAAENPGGTAGAMVGAGIGMGLGAQLGQTVAANQAAPGPPPLIAPMYHVEVNGQATGPYTVQQLQQAVQGGQLAGHTLVWTNGMAGWAAASSVAPLAPLFATPPPPPPPPPPPAPPAPPTAPAPPAP